MKNVVFKIIGYFFVVICIATHVLVTIPHHHHEGSVTACIDFSHCLSSDVCCPASSCPHSEGSHSHEGEDDNCPGVTIDLMTAERAQAGELISLQAVCCISDFYFCQCCALGERDQETESPLKHREQPIYGHLEFITSAIPPRAPSFTV